MSVYGKGLWFWVLINYCFPIMAQDNWQLSFFKQWPARWPSQGFIQRAQPQDPTPRANSLYSSLCFGNSREVKILTLYLKNHCNMMQSFPLLVRYQHFGISNMTSIFFSLFPRYFFLSYPTDDYLYNNSAFLCLFRAMIGIIFCTSSVWYIAWNSSLLIEMFSKDSRVPISR